MSQRDVMRRLWKLHRGNEAKVVAAYAKAERDGEIPRKSNTNDVSAEDYAVALLKDGLKKGWLDG